MRNAFASLCWWLGFKSFALWLMREAIARPNWPRPTPAACPECDCIPCICDGLYADGVRDVVRLRVACDNGSPTERPRRIEVLLATPDFNVGMPGELCFWTNWSAYDDPAWHESGICVGLVDAIDVGPPCHCYACHIRGKYAYGAAPMLMLPLVDDDEHMWLDDANEEEP